MEAGTGGAAAPSAPLRTRAGRRGLTRRFRLIAAVAASRDAWLVALAGFLLRGGLLLLALPIVVLPTPLGIAAVGLNAVTIAADPTVWLIEVVALSIALLAIWLVLATVVGSLVDAWLVDAAVREIEAAAGEVRAGERRATRFPPPWPVLWRLAAIRIVCLLPLAAALVWAGGRVYDAAYAELTLPTNLATPLLVRVVAASADAIAIVIAAWLAAELVAAIAVRRLLLRAEGSRPSVWRSLGGAAVELVRRPLETLLSLAGPLAGSVVVTAGLLAANAIAFDWARVAARDESGVALDVAWLSSRISIGAVLLTLAALAVAAIWIVALVVSGVASAARSAAFSVEVHAALVAGGPSEEPGLSTHAPDGSGD